MEEHRVTPALDDDSDASIEHLRFLYDAYVAGCFWWEILECVKKLLLTGLITFFFVDEVAQIAFAMLVALASVALLHVYRPYADRADQIFALAAGWQLVLIIFAGIVMGLNADEQDEIAREQYAALLAVALLGTVLIGTGLMAREAMAPLEGGHKHQEGGHKHESGEASAGLDSQGPGNGRSGLIKGHTKSHGSHKGQSSHIKGLTATAHTSRVMAAMGAAASIAMVAVATPPQVFPWLGTADPDEEMPHGHRGHDAASTYALPHHIIGRTSGFAIQNRGCSAVVAAWKGLAYEASEGRLHVGLGWRCQ